MGEVYRVRDVVSPDAKRFLIVTRFNQDRSSPINVVLHWRAGLRQ